MSGTPRVDPQPAGQLVRLGFDAAAGATPVHFPHGAGERQ